MHFLRFNMLLSYLPFFLFSAYLIPLEYETNNGLQVFKQQGWIYSYGYHIVTYQSNYRTSFQGGVVYGQMSLP